LFTGYKTLSSNSSSTSQAGQGTTADGKRVNLKPPTKEEKQSADANKEAIIQKNTTIKSAPTNTTQKKQIDIVITDATSNGVRAYVSGVFEEGGVCTATATQGSQIITQTSTGFQNVSYTQCAPINWGSPLANGTWSITLSYRSATAEGSGTKTIEVK
jgi:hypothetical protein